jgi:hypothetical protein
MIFPQSECRTKSTSLEVLTDTAVPADEDKATDSLYRYAGAVWPHQLHHFL